MNGKGPKSLPRRQIAQNPRNDEDVLDNDKLPEAQGVCDRYAPTH
jgi:hypothetical protein